MTNQNERSARELSMDELANVQGGGGRRRFSDRELKYLRDRINGAGDEEEGEGRERR